MDKDRSIHSISQDLSHTYKTVRRLATVIREAIYERRSEWLRPLTGEVEADDVHLKGGQQGRELASGESESEASTSESEASTSDGSEESTAGGREARERGLSERGSWEGDRPPAVLWVERKGEGGGARVIELRRGADQRSLFQPAWRNVEPGSRIDTDDFSGYGLLGEAYDHRSVDHEDTYVTEEGVRCNTAEAEWSVFKPWWNAFRGVAKRNIYHVLGVKIQLVLAHVDPDNEEIFGLNFAAYVGYVKHGKPPFLIQKMTIFHRESEASFSVFQPAQP